MPTIRELRGQHGWTQMDLAVKLDVQPSTVYAWEAGRSLPRVEQLRKLAEIFEVRMDDVEVSRTQPRSRKKVVA